MNNERLISTEADSMIYHKPGCRYVKRIQYKNLLALPRTEAKRKGYHVCRYCNGMAHHLRAEKKALDFYSRVRKMQFRVVDGILYVKSEIGCWKLVYSRREERFTLFHRNTTAKPLDFEHPQYEYYHRQDDKPFCYSIETYLSYIYEHDKYKAAVDRGETVTKFSSKKYAKREASAQRKRQDRRVDYLFRMLDRQNAGYRELSCC